MRASAFQDMGLLRMITPDMVSPEGLKKEISTALAMKRTDLVEKANEMLNFDGAHASASYLLTLLADRYPYHRFNVSKPKSTSAKTIVAEHV
jgi:predicted glycosyltransferase